MSGPAGRGRPRRPPGSGAGPDEVALTGSDTEGWTKALWGLALGGGLPAGRPDPGRPTSPTTATTWACCRCAGSPGTTHRRRARRADGTIDLDALADELWPAAAWSLVSATHVGTHRGLVNPVEEVGAALPGRRGPVLPRRLPEPRAAAGRRRAHRVRRGHRHRAQVAAGPPGHRASSTSGRTWSARSVPSASTGRSARWEAPATTGSRTGAARFMPFESPVAAAPRPRHRRSTTPWPWASTPSPPGWGHSPGTSAEPARHARRRGRPRRRHPSQRDRHLHRGRGDAGRHEGGGGCGRDQRLGDRRPGRPGFDMGGDRPESVVRASPHYLIDRGRVRPAGRGRGRPGAGLTRPRPHAPGRDRAAAAAAAARYPAPVRGGAGARRSGGG